VGYSTQQQPFNAPTNKYPQQQPNNTPTSKYAQQQQLNGYSNQQTPKHNDRSQVTNNNNTGDPATKKKRQPPQKKNTDNQHAESKNHQQVNSYRENFQECNRLHLVFTLIADNFNSIITILCIIMNV